MYHIFELKVTLTQQKIESNSSGFDVDCSIKTNPQASKKETESKPNKQNNNKQNTINKIKPFFIIQHK